MALNSEKNLLVVLHMKSNHPIAKKIRKEFDVFTLTLENREIIAAKIIEKITKAFQ